MSESTARNWRGCRHPNPQPHLLARALDQVAEDRPRADRLRFLLQLGRGTRGIRRAAEEILGELLTYTLSPSRGWHLYEGPLYVAFNPRLSAERRAELMERSGTVIQYILANKLDHREVPALPELIRYSVHGWHQICRFTVRTRSVRERIAEVGRSYLNRIEMALYLGDAYAMPSLFTGTVSAARRWTSKALSLLDDATPEDEKDSPVAVDEARIMVRSVEAQVLACHAPERTRATLERFLADYGTRCARLPWTENVRRAALGYMALRLDRSAERAAAHFQAASDHVDAWLARVGIPFGSTSHTALAGYCQAASGRPFEGEHTLTDALLRALEHRVIVDIVAARLGLARLATVRGGSALTSYHSQRAETLIAQYRLQAWKRALDGLFSAADGTPTAPAEADGRARAN